MSTYGLRPEQYSPRKALAIPCEPCTSGLDEEYEERSGDPYANSVSTGELPNLVDKSAKLGLKCYGWILR